MAQADMPAQPRDSQRRHQQPNHDEAEEAEAPFCRRNKQYRCPPCEHDSYGTYSNNEDPPPQRREAPQGGRNGAAPSNEEPRFGQRAAQGSSNAYANGAHQNVGNGITDRSSTRIHAPPGGVSTFSLAHGSSDAAAPAVRRAPLQPVSANALPVAHKTNGGSLKALLTRAPLGREGGAQRDNGGGGAALVIKPQAARAVSRGSDRYSESSCADHDREAVAVPRLNRRKAAEVALKAPRAIPGLEHHYTDSQRHQLGMG
jgi:hypothetical protein